MTQQRHGSQFKISCGVGASWIILLLILLGIGAGGCSTRRNTAVTRQYTAFITRYNVYYNGDKHYKETLEDMEKGYRDDFTRLLPVHPSEARADGDLPQPSGDFTRSIEKAQKAIQLRSIKRRPQSTPGRKRSEARKEFLKRSEYNPFLHNAWMMLGRSLYMNGDYSGAATTFLYISRQFKWLPATVLEAQVWEARCYAAMGWPYEASVVLKRIQPSALKDAPGEVREIYHETMASVAIREERWTDAVKALQEAINDARGASRHRLEFLLGQCYSRTGDRRQAYQAFTRASKGADYTMKLNSRIARSEVASAADYDKEYKALRSMTRYERNADFLDRIYYAMGNLAMTRRDTARAITSYREAIAESRNQGVEKALAELALAGIYYSQSRYDLAQPLYASAIPVLPRTYPGRDSLARRSDVLDRLAVYSGNVHLQDSLLALAAMPEADRLKAIDKLIAQRKKADEEAERQRRNDEARAQAEEARMNAASSMNRGGQTSAPTTFTMNGDNSWYFYNPTMVSAGKQEFQRRWGTRRLEDDWRRRDKNSFSMDELTGGSGTEEDSDGDEEPTDITDSGDDGNEAQETKKTADDPYSREYYLRTIPSTPVEIAKANEIVQDGLFNMGLILKDDLEDFHAADTEWQRLLTRYPDNIYRLDVYHNLYLMFMRMGDTERAERYRMLILSDFPDSPLGIAMRDPDYIGSLRRMIEREDAIYDEAYQAYLADDNARVHALHDEMARDFSTSRLMPKMMFVNAMAYVTDDNPEEFGREIKELLERYPDTELTPMASSYLRQLNRGRQLHTEGSNSRPLVWSTRLSAGEGDNDEYADSLAVDFALDAESPQMLVLMYPTDSVSANSLLYDVARHNFATFVVKDYDLEVMNFGNLGLLLIKGFENLDEVAHYRSRLSGSDLLLPRQVRPVVISVDDFTKLLGSGGSFDDYMRQVEARQYRAAQEAVLPPEIYEIDEL